MTKGFRWENWFVARPSRSGMMTPLALSFSTALAAGHQGIGQVSEAGNRPGWERPRRLSLCSARCHAIGRQLHQPEEKPPDGCRLVFGQIGWRRLSSGVRLNRVGEHLPEPAGDEALFSFSPAQNRDRRGVAGAFSPKICRMRPRFCSAGIGQPARHWSCPFPLPDWRFFPSQA